MTGRQGGGAGLKRFRVQTTAGEFAFVVGAGHTPADVVEAARTRYWQRSVPAGSARLECRDDRGNLVETREQLDRVPAHCLWVTLRPGVGG